MNSSAPNTEGAPNVPPAAIASTMHFPDLVTVRRNSKRQSRVYDDAWKVQFGSKKSKSKRTPFRKKCKILKKVKEHHKKKAKEAKKLGKSRKARVEKDSRIPNTWLFIEQELQALEARRAKALEEHEQKKEAKKEKRKLGLPDEEE
ncbi:unnamed protein product [Calypogeia fissa]